MKFSHTLMLNRNPEWGDKYVDFVGLKKLINNLSARKHDSTSVRDDVFDEMLVNTANDNDYAAEKFYKAVERESNKVSVFYHKKCNELDTNFERFRQFTGHRDRDDEASRENSPLLLHKNSPNQSQSLSDGMHLERIRKEIYDIYLQYHSLRAYAHLNCTAIRKIVKKYDKVCHDALSSTHMNRLKEMLPFWDGCPHINCAMEDLVTTFAHFFHNNNLAESRKKLGIFLDEMVVFQQRSVWLDVNAVNRRNEGSKMIKYEGRSSNWKRKCSTLQNITSNGDLKMGIGILVLFLGMLILPGIFDDDPAKRNALALIVFISLLWATEVIPLFVTAMMVPFLAVLLRVFVDNGIRLDANEASKIVSASMFSHVIMLLIGGFSIAAALSKHSLPKIAVTFLSKRLGANIQTVLLVNMLIATFASIWISNVAAPVLCISLVEPVLEASLAGKSRASFGTAQWISAEQDGRLCRALILGIALASNVGGMISPISSPQNLFAIEYAPIGWTTWFAISIPICITLDLAIWGWLIFCFDLPSADSAAVEWVLQRNRSRSEKLTIHQIYVVVVSVGVVWLWCLSVYLSSTIGQMGILGIVPFVLFFGTGILSNEDLNNFLWGVIFLAMGGLVLGEATKSSGLLDTCAGAIATFVESKSLTLWEVLCIYTALIFISATFMSHSVGAIVFLPVAKAVGARMVPSHATALVFAGAMACSSAMGLPASGFPNMTATGVEDKLGRPYLKTKDFIKYAVPASFFSWAIIVTLAYGLILLML